MIGAWKPDLTLDAKVARDVLGITVVKVKTPRELQHFRSKGRIELPFFVSISNKAEGRLYEMKDGKLFHRPFSPSSVTRDAGDLLNKFIAKYNVKIIGSKYKASPHPGKWVIEIGRSKKGKITARGIDEQYELAICRAMLEAAKKGIKLGA